jgi:hypothetical protein
MDWAGLRVCSLFMQQEGRSIQEQKRVIEENTKRLNRSVKQCLNNLAKK